MRTARLLFAAVVIALASSACSDMTGPAQEDDCPWIGGGGTCRN